MIKNIIDRIGEFLIVSLILFVIVNIFNFIFPFIQLQLKYCILGAGTVTIMNILSDIRKFKQTKDI